MFATCTTLLVLNCVSPSLYLSPRHAIRTKCRVLRRKGKKHRRAHQPVPLLRRLRHLQLLLPQMQPQPQPQPQPYRLLESLAILLPPSTIVVPGGFTLCFLFAARPIAPITDNSGCVWTVPLNVSMLAIIIVLFMSLPRFYNALLAEDCQVASRLEVTLICINDAQFQRDTGSSVKLLLCASRVSRPRRRPTVAGRRTSFYFYFF
jgi:hypothetical protein